MAPSPHPPRLARQIRLPDRRASPLQHAPSHPALARRRRSAISGLVLLISLSTPHFFCFLVSLPGWNARASPVLGVRDFPALQGDASRDEAASTRTLLLRLTQDASQVHSQDTIWTCETQDLLFFPSSIPWAGERRSRGDAPPPWRRGPRCLSARPRPGVSQRRLIAPPPLPSFALLAPPGLSPAASRPQAEPLGRRALGGWRGFANAGEVFLIVLDET